MNEIMMVKKISEFESHMWFINDQTRAMEKRCHRSMIDKMLKHRNAYKQKIAEFKARLKDD